MAASSYTTQLHIYTFAVRAYGMTEALADRASDRQDWLKELGRCAIKARNAAQSLAEIDPRSPEGAAWREEAAYWSRLTPQVGARRGDLTEGATTVGAYAH